MRLKYVFGVILSVLCMILHAQQTYYVTFFSGNIFKKSTNQKIRIGEKVSASDPVEFTSRNDFMILVNSNGRYEVSIKERKSASTNELVNILIKDNIHLHANNVRLSSRAINDEIDLSDYFKPLIVSGQLVTDKILIPGELKIPLQNMGYTHIDNSKDFFFLQLIDSGRNGINRKLIVRDDTLVLRQEDFIFNGRLYNSSDGILKLGFVKGYSTTKRTVKDIADVKPIFVPPLQLKEMAQAIRLHLSNLQGSDIIDEIYTQLCFFYGKLDRVSIEDLLKK